jgi:hypothetical protein
LYKLFGVSPGHRINRKTVHVTSFALTGKRTTVKGLSQSVKNPAQHFLPGYHYFKRTTKKTYPGNGLVETGCPFKYLNNGNLVTNGKYPALTRPTIRNKDFYLFIKSCTFDPLHNYQWSVDTFKTNIFKD